MKCEICGKYYERLCSLSSHLNKCHSDVNKQEYYDLYLKINKKEGKCNNCGCSTEFQGWKRGYKKYCSLKCQKEATSIRFLKFWHDMTDEERENFLKNREEQVYKNYGVKNVFLLEEIQKQAMETKQQNRPNDPNNKAKYQETMLLSYGVKHNWCNGKLREKEKETWIKIYGVDNPMKNTYIVKKQQETFAKTHNGALTPFQIPDIQEKAEKRANSHEARQKALKTQFKNKTRSSYEGLLAESLKKMNLAYFEEYDKDERYPFLCDFYIPFFDLFIEIHGYWVHNNHIFNKEDINDILTLDEWNKKAIYSSRYKSACKIWSERDVLKYNTALKNNLNYIILWTIEDIQKFIEDIEELWNEVK